MTTKETAYVLVGERQGSIWLAKMVWRTRGTETSVLFDGNKVLSREETHGDIIGFYHSHPEGLTTPSARDDATMSAWCFCFGKPLLCAISTRTRGVRAWVYGATEMSRVDVADVSIFNGKLLVAVVP
jgi:hypothetical protein